jgi:hypothetical protein
MCCRSEYNQKSRHLQEQLSDLRGEIDSLKVDDRQTEHDRIHAEHLQTGDDKYSTLRKVGPVVLAFSSLCLSVDLSTRLARIWRSNHNKQSG